MSVDDGGNNDDEWVDQLTVPTDVPALQGVLYLHGLFPESFLEELDELRAETPVFNGSNNMVRLPPLPGARLVTRTGSHQGCLLPKIT